MTNLEAWAKGDGSDELDTLLTLIRRQWEIGEMIRSGKVNPIPDFNLQESILAVVEWAWQESDDELADLELAEAKGNA